MRPHITLSSFTLLIMASSYIIWPVLHPYLDTIKSALLIFKQFCDENPFRGYLAYTILLAFILFLGLPFSMAIMLLAGITYHFWEALVLVTTCRLLVAIAAFEMVRHLMDHALVSRPQPVLIKKFEGYPKIGLLVARLSPLPDITVNYAMGATSLGCLQYAAVSLLGMIPLTLFCVWTGNELGSVNALINMLR